MKANATPGTPLGGIMWHGGAETFIYKRTNGRWRGVLTAEDCQHFESLAQQQLGPACADWLATGRR